MGAEPSARRAFLILMPEAKRVQPVQVKLEVPVNLAQGLLVRLRQAPPGLLGKMPLGVLVRTWPERLGKEELVVLAKLE